MMSNKKTILKKCPIDPGPLNVGDDTLTGALKINCNENIFSKIFKEVSYQQMVIFFISSYIRLRFSIAL